MASTIEKRSVKSAGPGGARLQSQEKYFFGSPDEIANRDRTGYPKGKAPQDNAPKFVQIPGGDSGKNMNDPSFTNRSGNFKFSKGV